MIDHTHIAAEDWPPKEFIDRVPSRPRRHVAPSVLYGWLNLPPKPQEPCHRCSGVRFWIRMPVTEKEYAAMGITDVGVIPALDDAEWRCAMCFDWETGNAWFTSPKKADQRLKKIKEQKLPRMVYVCIVEGLDKDEKN